MQELLDALERDLELDDSGYLVRRASEAVDDDELAPAPDFPGVVGAMVDEFLWEVEREEGSQRANRYACLRSFGRFGERIGVFEELSSDDLLRYATFWILEERALASPAEAERLIEALCAFCTWTEEAHEMTLARDFAPTLDSLARSLPTRGRSQHQFGTRGAR